MHPAHWVTFKVSFGCAELEISSRLPLQSSFLLYCPLHIRRRSDYEKTASHFRVVYIGFSCGVDQLERAHQVAAECFLILPSWLRVEYTIG